MSNNLAILFDMDGVLIDSEPLWRKAVIEIFKQVSITLTDEDCESTAGLRIDEVVEHWYRMNPWKEEPGLTRKDIEEQIVNELISLVGKYGEPMPGVHELLAILKNENLPMAIASSSSYRIIQAVTDKLNIAQYFNIIHSAEEERYGKPHPGIFISAAHELGVDTARCIVIEDSYNGVLAGLSARMKVVAIPDVKHYNTGKFNLASMEAGSLLDLNLNTLLALMQ